MDVYFNFIKENYDHKVVVNEYVYKVIYKHKDKLTNDGVVMFQSIKQGWNKKPIMPTNKYLIVDCNMTDVLGFLNSYYALDETNYKEIKDMVISMSVDILENHLDSQV